jgi:hypothetical protein
MTQVGRTPNIIRKHCAERFYLALPLLDQIIWGGLQLTPEAMAQLKQIESPVADDAEADEDKKVDQHPLLVATIKERLDALGLLARVGVGFRSDHTSDDHSLGAGVVLLPAWDDEVGEYEVIEEGSKGALPSGDQEGNGKKPTKTTGKNRGKGNGRRPKRSD